MKILKKIAFGAVTSAFCLISTVNSQAHRADISFQAGLSNYANNFGGVYGEKKAEANATGDDKNKIGLMDVLFKGFNFGLNVGGIFDINEYIGIGAVVGVNYEMKSATIKNNSNEEKSTSINQLQVCPGIEFMIYPLGEQSLLIGLTPMAKINVMTMVSNETVEKSAQDGLKENSAKAAGMFQFGGKFYVGYDFRDLMDFPLTLGLDTGFFFGSAVNVPTDGGESVFNNITYTSTDTDKAPSMSLSLNLKLGVDLFYFF